MAHVPHTYVTGETITASVLNQAEADLAAALTPADNVSADKVVDGTTGKQYTATEKTKLAGLSALPAQTSQAGKFLTTDGTTTSWGTPAGGTAVGDATTTTKGIVQLAGDLAGTAAAPTVPGLTGKLAAASNLSDVASAATARTNLGLGTAATQPSSAFDAAGAATTTQAFAIQRANHTGTQPASTITGLTAPYLLRAVTTAYAATVTPNGDTTDVLNIGALTGNITIANPAGTPIDGQNLRVRMAQDATGSRTVSFGTAYAFGTDITTALIPSAASAKWEMLFTWNAADSKWRATAIVRGF